jgi:hypothetical protein
VNIGRGDQFNRGLLLASLAEALPLPALSAHFRYMG